MQLLKLSKGWGFSGKKELLEVFLDQFQLVYMQIRGSLDLRRLVYI